MFLPLVGGFVCLFVWGFGFFFLVRIVKYLSSVRCYSYSSEKYLGINFKSCYSFGFVLKIITVANLIK